MNAAWHGPAFGLLAALLFGATGPFAKVLLSAGMPALVLAAILYGGAALGLTGLWLLRPGVHLRFTRTEVVCLAVAVLTGGFLAPILQMIGLARQTGLVASLLLNLEAPSTVLLAVLFFGERTSRRMWAGGALTITGSLLLGATGQGGGSASSLVGSFAISASCLAWAVDNNVTVRVSRHDPLRIAMYKCIAATPLLVGMAAAQDGNTEWVTRSAAPILVGLVLGFVGYGVSLVFYVRALRSLGAARMGLLWASAPFVGALVAMPVLGEKPTPLIAVAGLVMGLGVVLLVKEPTTKSGG
jgi:drug/metabolite transporter (DMT)-like permease